MLQMRRPGQRDLQTTAQIRIKLDNENLYNISVNNYDTMSKRKALVLAVYVFAVRSHNEELEKFIHDQLRLNESQLQLLALYKERILSAKSEQEVEQIHNEISDKMESLFETDEENFVDFAKKFDPTVPVPPLAPLPPELAAQRLCSNGPYRTNMTLGRFHNNLNDYLIVLNESANEEYEQGNKDKAVAIKQEASKIRQAGKDAISGHEQGNVEQVNHNIGRIIRIQKLVGLAYMIGGDKCVETLLDALNNSGFNTDSGVFNNNSLNVERFVNEITHNTSPAIEGESSQSSNFSFGGSNG